MTKRIVRTANNILALLILLSSAYLAGAPLIPELTYAAQKSIVAPAQEKASLKKAGENRLSINEIFVDGLIHEGEDAETTLHKGLWRRPKSSTPDKGGNTVIVAHRFLFTDGPNTFYHLPKIEPGDELNLVWGGKNYSYLVTETKIVSADTTDIEKNTPDDRLTLYTCTPLWSSHERFVVVAKPIQSP